MYFAGRTAWAGLVALSLAPAAGGAAAPLQDWIATSGGGSGDAIARFETDSVLTKRAIVVDAAGNTYIAGSIHNGADFDYLTQKFDASGTLLWSARYDGPGDGHDHAHALALDPAGNVVVTGVSAGVRSIGDYATLKYSGASGAPLWSGASVTNGAARYDGPGVNSFDQAVALAVDADGDVVVTGYSRANAVAADFVTLKYAGADGAPLWAGTLASGAARYNGPGNSEDLAVAVAIDANGDVVVAGTSSGGASGPDYATLKYARADGSTLWSGGSVSAGAARYNGPANGSDTVHGLALDGNGDVLVTGRSPGAGTGSDFATVKYSGTGGAPLWAGGAARYNAPTNGNEAAYAIAVDPAGASFVTGSSNGGADSDYLTVKLDADGTLVWIASYNGPASASDIAFALGLDGNGDVLVTGTSQGVGTQSDYATLKYSGTNGAPQWSGGAIVSGAARYNGPVNGIDEALALAVDAGGDVRVAGTRTGSVNEDFGVVRYSGTSGAQAWAASEGPATNVLAEELGANAVPYAQRALAVDAAGNSYVTGFSHDGRSTDYLTQKFDASGALLWSARYNGPGNGQDVAHALMLDGNGDVIVTGTSAGSGTSFDYATLKYSGATGAPLWTGGAIVNGAARYNGPANAFDAAHALAVDASGNVVVTGQSTGTSFTSDYATLKYSGATGASMWPGGAVRYNGPGNGSDVVRALALAGNGDAVVTGFSTGSGGNVDYATLRYSSTNGAPQWSGGAILNGAARYNGTGNGTDQPAAVAIDDNGDVVVTGSSAGVGTASDYATVKYAGATGAPLWTGGSIVAGAARYNGPVDGSDGALAIALFGNGDVVVTGSSAGTGTGSDYATLKYSGSNGAPLWAGTLANGAARYNGPGNGTDAAHAVALVASGDVVVTGGSVGDGTGADYATLRYSGANGAEAWSHRYDGGASASDQAFALAHAADGSLRVAGSAVTPQGRRYAVLKLREPGGNAALSALGVTGRGVSPAFAPDVTTYSSTVGAAASLEVSATAQDAAARIEIAGQPAQTGASIRTVPLAFGANAIVVSVTAEDGATTRLYTLTAYRAGIALDPGTLGQAYTGSPRVATATTQPAGLAHALAYEGIDGTVHGPSSTPPTNAGRYRVTATITEAGYEGSAVDTLVVAKAGQGAFTASAMPARIVFGNTSALGTQGGAGNGAVSFAVTAGAGKCTIVGTLLTGTGVGACVATATKDGDANHHAAAASIEVIVTPKADLQLAIDAERSVAQAGDVVVYSIVATNAGPNDVSGAILGDAPPPSLANVEWACMPGASSAACPPAPHDAGSGAMSVAVDLPAGASVRYDLSATLQPTSTLQIQNGASVTAPVDTFDPDLDNNSGVATIEVTQSAGIFGDGFE